MESNYSAGSIVQLYRDVSQNIQDAEGLSIGRNGKPAVVEYWHTGAGALEFTDRTLSAFRRDCGRGERP